MHNFIAVPSRICCSRTAAQPLQGLRIAVKDIFHIKGLRTSLGNQAYLETYAARTETAKCIKTLVELGAHIVGTTKLAAFAATEEPLECIDFQAPWNPRADGHQSPAGSSSGSGVAVAAYEWLDVAIGSDSILLYSIIVSGAHHVILQRVAVAEGLHTGTDALHCDLLMASLISQDSP